MGKKRSMSGKLRQRITWQRDNAADGAQEPTYGTTLAERVACSVTQVTGNETYHGVQLEGHVDYVVTQWYSSTLRLKPWDRGIVKTGTHADKTLNVRWVKDIGFAEGTPPRTEVYCTELVA
jgi:hypothetical protein